MFKLIYASRATARVDEAQLCQLADAAALHNLTRGITGALIYGNGLFLQQLEGGEPDVRGVFDRIARDPRHCDVLILFEEETRYRNFPRWGMASLDARSLDAEQQYRLVALGRSLGALLPSDNVDEVARDLMLELSTRLRGEFIAA